MGTKPTSGTPRRPKNSPPAYCRHKATGRAYVKLGGKRVYLGAYGTKASRTEYERVLAEWLSNGKRRPDELHVDAYTVADLVADYLTHAKTYYRDKDGSPTTSVRDIAAACRELLRLYRDRSVATFGIGELKTVRTKVLAGNGRGVLARTTVNDRIGRIVAMFGWGADEQRVPPAVFGELRALRRLKRGRSEARETEPVRPVAWDDVDATLPYLPAAVAAMVRIQWHTGCRPGEVVQVRAADIAREGKVWCYRPRHHKTEHHGHERVVGLGPEAQRVLLPWLDRVPRPDPELPLFRPEIAISEPRRITRGPNAWFRATAKPRKPTRVVHDAYDVWSYRHAIARGVAAANVDRVLVPRLLRAWRDRGPVTIDMMQDTYSKLAAEVGVGATNLHVFARCYLGEYLEIDPRDEGRVTDAKGHRSRRVPKRTARRVLTDAGNAKAGEAHELVPSWSPGQLRHSAATRLTRELGLEAARVVLGHRSPITTLVYAEIDRVRALDVMEAHG